MKILSAALLIVLSISNLSFSASEPYLATAYCLKGRTASGTRVAKGIVAADKRLHRLGSRIWINAGNYSGSYLVADTGGAIKGKRLDIWVENCRLAMKFGKRKVYLRRI